jgi:hypothetical protein
MEFNIKTKVLTAFAALFLTATPAFGADHRDSPTPDDNPAADINDVYMFRDPADATKLVIVLSTFALEDPRFAPSYHYDNDVILQIAFDTTGNGDFSRFLNARFSALSNGPGSAQAFTIEMPNHVVVTGPVTQPTVQAPQPTPLITSKSGVTVFAGQRDDPFFFDLIGFNRVVAEINATSVNGGPGTVNPALFTGVDSFAGFNVQALVIEAPITYFVGNANKFGISAFSYKKFDGKISSIPDHNYIMAGGKVYAQLDRMGNPAVNTAFIAPALKDKFNLSLPKNDYRNFGPTILATLKKYGTNTADTDILASIVFPDTLKMDLSKPDGFPNGRRLADDVINLELQITFNQPSTFNDGVTMNDEPYLTSFPFVGLPHTAPVAASN